MAYPATFDVTPPAEYDKAQIALRILIIIVLAVLGISVTGLAYLLLPVIAAVMIAQNGAERYLREAESGPVTWLRYLMGFFAYMTFASERLPTEKPEEVVDFQVQPSGTPTVGSALLRLIYAIPHAIVLWVLGIVVVIAWIVAAVSIIINGDAPDWTKSFMRGYLRWMARLGAYLASLVDEYPPFSFENGSPAMATEPPAAPSQPPAPPPGEGDTGE